MSELHSTPPNVQPLLTFLSSFPNGAFPNGTAYSCDYYFIQVFDESFTASLETHSIDFAGTDGSWDYDSGAPLCSDYASWPHHDYYFADGNGNIVTLIDTNQSVSASYRYDPFGNITSQSGSMADANVYRFSSKEFHAASGMYYYGYRFYDPVTQRWGNADPIGERGGVNLYAFTGNSPINRLDRLGLDAAVINHGGGTGHTSFAIIQADGTVTAFHFYARSHQNQKCCGLGSLLSVCCDKVSVWQESAASLGEYIASQGTDVRIVAYAFGTDLDDQVALADLNEQDKADAGIYSLAAGIQCHMKSQEWFRDYVKDGQRINVSRVPGSYLDQHWPEAWYETPGHRNNSFSQYGISTGGLP